MHAIYGKRTTPEGLERECPMKSQPSFNGLDLRNFKGLYFTTREHLVDDLGQGHQGICSEIVIFTFIISSSNVSFSKAIQELKATLMLDIPDQGQGGGGEDEGQLLNQVHFCVWGTRTMELQSSWSPKPTPVITCNSLFTTTQRQQPYTTGIIKDDFQ
jgi:hypothetical protein